MNKKLDFDFNFLDSDSEQEDVKAELDEKSKDDTAPVNVKQEGKSDIKYKNVMAILIIFLIICGIGIAVYNDNKAIEINQIKNTAYEYLKQGNDYEYNNELNKLYKYNEDVNAAKTELAAKFNDEKQRVISDLAYAYENNTENFNSLKQESLPVFFNNDENLFNSAVEEKLGYKELSLKPLALPPTGILHNYTGRPAIAFLELKTRDNENFYIKLVNPYTQKTEIVIFVRGGNSKTVHVPLGTYQIKTASGTTWYGEKYRFGHKTQYITSHDLLKFNQTETGVTIITLTLYKMPTGNFETEDIKAEDF